jgi:hypothetical protein
MLRIGNRRRGMMGLIFMPQEHDLIRIFQSLQDGTHPIKLSSATTE